MEKANAPCRVAPVLRNNENRCLPSHVTKRQRISQLFLKISPFFATQDPITKGNVTFLGFSDI